MNELICGVVRIVAVTDKTVWVESETQTACGDCAMAKGCGTKVISGYFGRNTSQLAMINDFNGIVGDRLEVGVKNTALLKSSALIYLLPLSGLLIGAILGSSLNNSDILSAALGLLGLIFGFYFARSLYVSAHLKTSMAPVFLKKLVSVEEKQ